MKLLWCCLTVALTITASKAALDVEKTVKQVQTILQANTLLPRLNRDEIIQLLNDIRAEDAKSTSSSSEGSKEAKTTTPYNTQENEISSSQVPYFQDNIVSYNKNSYVSTSIPTNIDVGKTEAVTVETTTKKDTLMVVLPYTPRDGSSLQELYTKPPRVEVVPVSSITPKPVTSNNKIQETLKLNAKVAETQKQDLPSELQAFLDMHGLKGIPGQDHFLLPLDQGFKPLPPATVIDGTVQLPENILLTYDLIAPGVDTKSTKGVQPISNNNFLYEPLRPELPFELDTSSSETKEVSLPYDMPKPRKTKSITTPKPNYEPIDYDAIKVIPLNKGVNPVEESKLNLDTDQIKRQTDEELTTVQAEAAETTTEEAKSATVDSEASADTDKGASLADLEDSFGGAAPEQPGGSLLPPPKKNGFYWMLDWNSFLEVGDGDSKVNIRFEPKFGDPQMFLPVSVP